MKEDIKTYGFHWRTYLFVFVFVILGFIIFRGFFSYETCDIKSCFDSNLRSCDKAIFAAGDKMIFEYTIKGKSGDNCEVEVELLQGDLSSEDSRKLEGKSMICTLPLGVVVAPESDISVCHGLLKEGLQDLVIKKLHTYLIKNLGKISMEIFDLTSA